MTRQKTVSKSLYANHVRKAEQFFEIMETAFQKQQWDACVSSAVHAIICIIDAISVQQRGLRSGSESHIETVLILNEIKTGDEKRKSNLKQEVHALINMKTLAEYEDRLMSKSDAEAAVNRCRKIYTFLKQEIEKGKI